MLVGPVNELKEVLVQMYAYAGFPRSLNGLNTFIDVLEDRQRRGIADEVGREPSPRPAHKSTIEVGTRLFCCVFEHPCPAWGRRVGRPRMRTHFGSVDVEGDVEHGVSVPC